MNEIKKLIEGFQRFRAHHYERGGTPFKQLVSQGQSPKIMVVACSDSRVDPAIVTDCDPGDLFVVRNVANLVPPYEEGGGYHGTSAALEFAVSCLRVEHVIVMGHARCGGIRALLGNIRFEGGTGQFITPWMSIAEEARREVAATHAAADADVRAAACERAAMRVSLGNLTSFPFVRDAVAAGRLHGYDAASGGFELLGG
jgi:carbonic anhydrase